MFILGFIVCYRESPDSTFEVYLEVSHPGTHSSGKCLKVGANSFRVCNIMLCCIQQCAITAGFKHGVTISKWIQEPTVPPIQSNEKCSSTAYSKMVLRLLLLLPVVVMTSAWGPKKYSLPSAIYQFNLALVLNKLQQEWVLKHGSKFALCVYSPTFFFCFFCKGFLVRRLLYGLCKLKLNTFSCFVLHLKIHQLLPHNALCL